MQTYIGTKTILAVAMTLAAYNEKRGWQPPEGEDQTAEGYLVEYVDGGKPNHPDHAGYISWSPKDVFERSYRLANTARQRVELELTELNDKLTKLGSFLDGKKFGELDIKQRGLLHEQHVAMQKYGYMLTLRLNNWQEI